MYDVSAGCVKIDGTQNRLHWKPVPSFFECAVLASTRSCTLLRRSHGVDCTRRVCGCLLHVDVLVDVGTRPGVDICELDPQWLRRTIGMVAQVSCPALRRLKHIASLRSYLYLEYKPQSLLALLDVCCAARSPCCSRRLLKRT